jgi:glycosyltransferase involved in cell wall biosynthesis
VKILFDHHSPFVLAHGGFALQVQATHYALRGLGCDVSYLRWWADQPRPDLIHYFGPCPAWYLRFARAKGIKTVVTQLHTGLGSRPPWLHRLQGLAIGVLKKTAPPAARRLGWDSYDLADAIIALTPYEADLIRRIFHAPADRVHVVPNGVDDAFLESKPVQREDWLICTAAITERKRVVELTEAATLAGAKLKVFGRPYSEDVPYFLAFKEAVARSGGLVEWGGEVTDRQALADLYRRARAFVLPSTMESLSLSALEAAACQCPLVLTDLPWARATFRNTATYLPRSYSPETWADSIKTAACQRISQGSASAPSITPISWSAVAGQLRLLYEKL